MILDNTLDWKVKLNSIKVSELNDSDVYIKLGKIGILDVYMESYAESAPYIHVMDCRRKGAYAICAMETTLVKERSLFRRKTYGTQITKIDDRYKGYDLAPKLYAFLLRTLPNFMLVSGESHSVGGRSIWNRLCNESGISVYAVNPRTKEYYPCEYGDEGEVESEVAIYASDDKNPYRLYAIANNN
jgi:hypothetical protein